MEYYLIQFEALTGVVESTLGFTEDYSVAQKEIEVYDKTHAEHKNYNALEHECPSCDNRITVTAIYKYAGM